MTDTTDTDMQLKIALQPYETMKQFKALERLEKNANLIHRVIRDNPGIPSVAAIAAKTGQSVGLVKATIRRMNAGETGHVRIDYGWVRPRGGPYAGSGVTGWFAMTRKAYHSVMDQADEHSALTELGVRRSRLIRLGQAQGITNAEEIVERIEERLGLSVEAMSEKDMEAFMELLVEAAEDE